MLVQGQSSSAKRGGLTAVSSGLIILKKKQKKKKRVEDKDLVNTTKGQAERGEPAKKTEKGQ